MSLSGLQLFQFLLVAGIFKGAQEIFSNRNETVIKCGLLLQVILVQAGGITT